MKISATIITLNEEAHIAACLKSLTFADEIVVIDSGSTDRTVGICEDLGAKVIFNAWPGFGQQKNFAADHASNDWCFSIDADEVVDNELCEAILKIKNEGPISSCYEINRKTYLKDKFIRHSGWYPDRLVRLYDRTKARFTEPPVHEELKVSEKPLKLAGHIDHYSFDTMEAFVAINIKYGKLAAKRLLEKRNWKRPPFIALVLRPLSKFFECLFLKGGIMDGKEGFIIAYATSFSMFIRYLYAIFDTENLKKIK